MDKHNTFKKRLFFTHIPNILLIFLFFHITPFYAQAQYFNGPVSSGMGGAGVAGAEAAEGTLINPAVVSQAANFDMGLFYSDGYLAQGEHKTLFGINIVDNSSSLIFPGSLAFFKNRETVSGLGGIDEEFWNVSVGKFYLKNLSFGFSVHYLKSEGDQLLEDYTQWSGNLGLLFIPRSDLGFGFVFYNVIKPSDDIPVPLRQTPKISFGMTYILNEFVKTRLDLSRLERQNVDKKWDVAGGLESKLSEFLVFRLGARWEAVAKRAFYTSGVSFNGPKLKVDYSIEKNNKGTNGALHSVDLRLPF